MTVKCFPIQKSQILVTLPENAQDSTIYYLHSHLKNTVKLHITVFSEVNEYKTLNMYVSHFYRVRISPVQEPKRRPGQGK